MSPATGSQVVVGFRDHDRQRYMQNALIEDAGEFNIGCFHEDGSPTLHDGEFRVTLVQVRGRLLPHVEAFGEGEGALRRAIDLGLLGQLGVVRDHIEFSERLIAIGLIDLSDLKVGEEGGNPPEHGPRRWMPPEDPAFLASRQIESVALARIVEIGPGPSSEARLIVGLMEDLVYDPERVAAIKQGVVELVGVGLLEKDGDALTPTSAAVRSAELELGLGAAVAARVEKSPRP
jgi:hypothetical protein